MATIGIYDADYLSGKKEWYNLEAMKLSAYYKKRREIVSLSPSFSPELYSKFYYVADFENLNDIPIIPDDVITIGHTFYDKYKLLPAEIEKCKPDLSLYPTEEDLNSRRRKRGWHIRISSDEKVIDDKFTNQKYIETELLKLENSSIFCYDYNVGKIENGYKWLYDTMEYMKSKNMRGSCVLFKYPLYIDNVDDFERCVKMYRSTIRYRNIYRPPFILSGIYDTNENIRIQNSLDLMRSYKGFHVKNPAVIYDFTKGNESTVLEKNFHEIMITTLSLWSRSANISLKYDDKIISNKKWQVFFNSLNDYLNLTNFKFEMYPSFYYLYKDLIPEIFDIIEVKDKQLINIFKKMKENKHGFKPN